MEVVSLEGLDSQMVLTVCLGLGGKEREALLEEEESFSKFFNLFEHTQVHSYFISSEYT